MIINKKNSWKKGEIALTFTIAVMAIVMMGGLIGAALNRNPQTTTSKAAAAKSAQTLSSQTVLGATKIDASKTKRSIVQTAYRFGGITTTDEATQVAREAGIIVDHVSVNVANRDIQTMGGTILKDDQFFMVTDINNNQYPMEQECANLHCPLSVRVRKTIKNTDQIDQRLVGAKFEFHWVDYVSADRPPVADVLLGCGTTQMERNSQTNKDELIAVFRQVKNRNLGCDAPNNIFDAEVVFPKFEDIDYYYISETYVPAPFVRNPERKIVRINDVSCAVAVNDVGINYVTFENNPAPVVSPIPPTATPTTTPMPTATPLPTNTPAPQACEYKSTVRLYEWVDANNNDVIDEGEKRRPPVLPNPQTVSTAINDQRYGEFLMPAYHELDGVRYWEFLRGKAHEPFTPSGGYVFQVKSPGTLKNFRYGTSGATNNPNIPPALAAHFIAPYKDPINIEGGLATITQLLRSDFEFVQTECRDIKGTACVFPQPSEPGELAVTTENKAILEFQCNADVEYAFVMQKKDCPFASTAFIDIPATDNPADYRIQSTSGGGMVKLSNIGVSPLGGGRKRATTSYQTANLALAENTIATIRVYKNGQLVPTSSISSVECTDKSGIERCKTKEGNKIDTNLACNISTKPGVDGEIYYGWVITQPTQGGGPTATPQPTSKPSVGKIDQMDVNQSYWIKKNIGACSTAGSDHGTCPFGDSYECSTRGDTITVKKKNQGDAQRIYVEKYTGCKCNDDGECRTDRNWGGQSHPPMFDEVLGDDETSITCNINSDRCNKQPNTSKTNTSTGFGSILDWITKLRNKN